MSNLQACDVTHFQYAFKKYYIYALNLRAAINLNENIAKSNKVNINALHFVC